MKINSEYSKLCLTAQQEVGVRSYAAYKVRRNTMSPGECCFMVRGTDGEGCLFLTLSKFL